MRWACALHGCPHPHCPLSPHHSAHCCSPCLAETVMAQALPDVFYYANKCLPIAFFRFHQHLLTLWTHPATPLNSALLQSFISVLPFVSPRCSFPLSQSFVVVVCPHHYSSLASLSSLLQTSPFSYTVTLSISTNSS